MNIPSAREAKEQTLKVKESQTNQALNMEKWILETIKYGRSNLVGSVKLESNVVSELVEKGYEIKTEGKHWEISWV